jgi:hypothetical protein
MRSTVRKHRPSRGTRRRYMSDTQYINQLKQLYPSCVHDNNKDKLCKQYDGHTITYGEMTYEGLEALYTHILQYGDPSYFLDVGSGRGKLCLYMAAKPNILKSYGIELVADRVRDANRLKRSLAVSPLAKKCEFLNANIFDISISDKITGPAFVWFSNLCFEPSTTEQIYTKLVDELPVGSVICSSKIPENPPTALRSLGNIQIAMSWNTASNVFLYQKQ